MFYGCESFTSLDLLAFNTENVTDMSWMFYRCSKLTEIDLSKFDTEKVTNMTGMFYHSYGLTKIYDSAFERCENLKEVHTRMTENEWGKVINKGLESVRPDLLKVMKCFSIAHL